MENYIFAVIGAVGTGCSILFAFLGYQKGIKKDISQESATDGALRADTEYIKKSVDLLIMEQKEFNKGINSINERLVRVEESTKQAHKRLDHIEGRD